MNTVAIVQARLGSTRLPGKVLKDLCGQSVLGHVLLRLQACKWIDQIVVATTEMPQDEAIVAEADRYHVKSFRGSSEDVLSRYYFAAQKYHADTVVRVTSDDPLVDPEVLTEMLKVYRSNLERGTRIDYLSNNLGQRTYPLGLDAEILSMDSLGRAHREAKTPSEREHVTPYIYGHPEKFALRSFLNSADQSAHRWTLDTEDDWLLISGIYSGLYKPGQIFSTEEVLEFLRQKPDLVKINAHVQQRQA